jgi:hypothetical protein
MWTLPLQLIWMIFCGSPRYCKNTAGGNTAVANIAGLLRTAPDLI